MARRVLVINPNSSPTVTDGIRRAVRELPQSNSLELSFTELQRAPPGIETDAHVAAAVPLLRECIREQARHLDACVIACFSDPGIDELRGLTELRLIGIGEAAYHEASHAGRRFGVVSIAPQSVTRHAAYVERLGLTDHLAGDRPLNLSVAELQDRDKTWAGLLRVGRTLLERDKAQALILGCAGMADYRKELESVLGLPVIEPSQSAIRRLLEIEG